VSRAGRGFALLGFVASTVVSAPARAEDPGEPSPEAEEVAAKTAADDSMPPPGYLPGRRERVGLGLSPHAPGEQSVLPGGIAPAFGAPLRPNEGAKFDFQGHLQAGVRAGFNSRKEPTDEQSSTVWHGDPIVPRGNVFENTHSVPYSWAELRFSYSTPAVTATVSLGAWQVSEPMQASGSFMPNAQLWIRNAFLTYEPRGLDPVKLSWKVGVFEDRYGGMAQYSTGQYGAPLVATVFGVGETLAARLPLSNQVELALEHGIKTDLDRSPVDVPTGPSNNWPKPWEGQTFVNHAHVGLSLLRGMVEPTVHYISAFARDDSGDDVHLGNLRAGNQEYPGSGVPVYYPALDHADGSLTILGADVRLSMQRFGYLTLGVAHSSAEHIRTVSDVVQILNAGGGRDLMDRYFGRNNNQGRGTLLLAGGEYSVGLGELLRYPDEFWGEGPDLKLSVYGLYGTITSDDPARDGEEKLKFGCEGVYSLLSWLALAGRFDRATPYLNRPKKLLYRNQNDNTYSVLTAKMVLRSDWQAREALTLQYSRYFYRSDYHMVTLNSGGQISQVSDQPDENLLALYGTLWW
jgi:hypothetical protein